MIPSSISAALSADLTYNPNVHVQTVEIDRTGSNLLTEATDSFVKWYLHLSEFKKLCWNTKDMGSYGPAGVDSNTNIFAFAREATDPAYTASDAAITGSSWSFSALVGTSGHGWQHADAGQGAGVILTEASGGAVKFPTTALQFYVPLVSDTAVGAAGAGEAAYVGGGSELVSFDRATFTSDMSNAIPESQAARSHRATPSATSTTWAFDDASFSMTVNWLAATKADANGYDSNMGTWGHNQIYVTANAGATIAVTKPYNDAAADFIQIGMDASASSTFASSSASSVGVTTYDVNSHGTDGAAASDGLSSAGGINMATDSVDRVTDSVDYAAYFSDYTANTAPDASAPDAKRNYINVNVGAPTLQVTNSVFTEALQEAINRDGTSRNVDDSVQLRAALEAAFNAGHLHGFQADSAGSSRVATTYHASAVELPLPFQVAAQDRKVAAQVSSGAGNSATAALDHDAGGGEDKKVWLTPVIKLVADSYSHGSWFKHRGHGV